MLQTHGKFIKYVLLTLHRITHEQMKMNPIKPIIKVKTNGKLDTKERSQTQLNKHPPYQTKRKRNILHFWTCQNEILNLT